MSSEYTNVVESSCIFLIPAVRTKNEAIIIGLLPRSFKGSWLPDDVIDKIDSICSLLDNVEVGFSGRELWLRASPVQNRLIRCFLKAEYEKQCPQLPS